MSTMESSLSHWKSLTQLSEIDLKRIGDKGIIRRIIAREAFIT